MDDLRVLVGLGLTLLLVMLRLEAERFGAAEYDEIGVRGRRPSLRCAGSPGTSSGCRPGRRACVVHPDAGSGPVPAGSATAPRRSSAASCSAAVGHRCRPSAFAWLPLPPPAPARTSQPTRARSLNALAHGVHRRGRVPRRAPRLPARRRACRRVASRSSSRRSCTCWRRASGAPGRDRYMLVLSSSIGLVGGWATIITGGIGAAFLGHAITRFARLPGDRPRRPAAPPGPRGRGRRAAAPDARRAGAPIGRGGRRLRAVTPLRGMRVRRPAPLGRRSRLYVHIPFCVSLCPYCDFVVYAGRGGARAGEPDRRVRRGARWPRSSCGPTRSTRVGRPGPDRGRRSARSTSAAARRSLLPRRRARARSSSSSARRFGLAPDAEVTLEANPGPDERGDLAGRGARPA